MSAPSTGKLLTEWTLDPSLLLGIALFVGLYWYAVGPWRERHNLGPPISRGRWVLFGCTVVTLIVALVSPLDTLGDAYLFSAHMVQHLLLATVWPPLLLLSLPPWLVEALLRWRPLREVWSVVTLPVLALLLFNGALYFWHIPYFYDLTLQSEPVHITEHLTFMVFGVCNWWPILAPDRAQRLTYPFQVLYLVLDAMLMMVLGIIFTFVPSVIYTPYLAAPRLWGISHLEDQQLGGLIMWYPGNLPYVVWMVIAFYRWFDTGEETSTQRIGTQSPTIGPPVA